MGPTQSAARWVASLEFEDIPDAAVDKAKLQILSVLAACAHGARASKVRALRRAMERGGTGTDGPCSVIGMGRSSLWDAVYLNAASSVVHDFDDYLFAGHTGHSSVLVSLAVAELLSSEGNSVNGRRLITAQVAANEVGGRLGASMLLGPHNGQMWSYIHLIAGAVAASKLLGLDADDTESAIGLAFSQPNYPLVATFMGSDAKQLIASQPAVDGAKGAFQAAEGLEGAKGILEDRGGFWARIHKDAISKMFSGFGRAWVTESTSYKIYPGCAYLDTAEDALFEVMAEFAQDRGRPLGAQDVKSVRIEAGMLTAGMETMSGWYRNEHISPMNVNFSAALSCAITIIAGRLTPEELEPEFYISKESDILELASKVQIVSSPEMTAAMISPAESGSTFDLREILKKPEDALEGVDFSGYQSRFPARLTLTTEDGKEYSARQDIPLGGAGRPAEETTELVQKKVLGAMNERIARDLLGAVEALEDLDDTASLLASLAKPS